MNLEILNSQIQRKKLFTEQEADTWASEFKNIVEMDKSKIVQAALDSSIAQQIRSFGGWYQRIYFPDHQISTTSDHQMAAMSPGSLNTLGGRLTPREASILRPLPKWNYIKRLLPDLSGKTVLELGSSNGFFSLQFATHGAIKVTGIELLRAQSDAAKWSAITLGLDRQVNFINTDILTDRTIAKHDIVFLSEVHNHFPLPFLGLLRIINLAKELVIFDNSGIIPDTKNHTMRLNVIDKPNGRLNYTHCTMSEELMLQFLNLIGIPSSKVKAYPSPVAKNHILYLIDTSELAIGRLTRGYPEYLRDLFDSF